jgi:hypothetical protein
MKLTFKNGNQTTTSARDSAVYIGSAGNSFLQRISPVSRLGSTVALVAAANVLMSCSSALESEDIGTPDPTPPAGTFRIADEYEQHSTIVDCVMYDNGVTTIELVKTQSVHVTLTKNATEVNMIGFGGSGSGGPSLTYTAGTATSGPATVVRNGDTFTITGTAIAVIDDPSRPLIKPFEIVATAKCRHSTNRAPATLPP